jgi:predicted nucleic acid-binding protein
MIVVDTTVLTELFVHETTSAAVERLRRQNPEWAAPDLWRHELICVMWKHIRIGWGSVPVAESAMKLADEIMGSTTFRLSAATVLSTALEFEISTYDAHFVALAREMNTTLYTHDRSLIKKCPEIAKHPEEVG